MLIVNHKGRKVKITYRNDVIFKQTLGKNDKESRELLKFVVEAVTGKKYRELRVTNTESLGKFVLNKRCFLDIKAVDEHGRTVNIEMQQSDINEYEYKRFQLYGYRSIGENEMSGDDYRGIQTVDQIIFTTSRLNNQLVTEYKQREKSGKTMPYNLASFYFISLPEIEKIMLEKKRTHEALTDIEMLSYIYQKEVDDDIISVSDERQKRMITLMNKKFNEATSQEEILDEAKEAAYYDSWLEAQIETSVNRGRDEGLVEGRLEGIKHMIINYAEKIFNEDIRDWLDLLNDKQLEIIEDNIFKVQNLNELKKMIDK